MFPSPVRKEATFLPRKLTCTISKVPFQSGALVKWNEGQCALNGTSFIGPAWLDVSAHGSIARVVVVSAVKAQLQTSWLVSQAGLASQTQDWNSLEMLTTAGTTGAGTGIEAVGTCLLVLSVFKKKVPQCLNHTMSWCLIVHNTLLVDFVINSIVMTTDSKPASHRCSGNPGLQGQHTWPVWEFWWCWLQPYKVSSDGFEYVDKFNLTK